MNSSTSSCNLDRVRVKYRDKMSSDMTPAVVEFGRLTKMDLESNAIPRKLLTSVVSLYGTFLAEMSEQAVEKLVRTSGTRTLLLLSSANSSKSRSNSSAFQECPVASSSQSFEFEHLTDSRTLEQLDSSSSSSGFCSTASSACDREEVLSMFESNQEPSCEPSCGPSCEPTKPTSLDETSELFSKRSKNHDDEANIEVLAALTFTKEYSFTSNRVLVIDFMAVSENKQGKGLGSYLIKKLTSPSIGGPFSCVKAKVCRRNRSAIDFFRKNGFISDQILSLKYNCEKSNLRFKKYEPIERMQYSETVLELFLLPPIVPKTNRDHLGNILTMKTLDADIDSWRVKSLDAYQEEICLVLKMKKEIRRLTSMIKEKNDEIHYLKRENSQLKTVVDCTNPFAAISAIDQIDVMFSNLKDVYNKLMID